MDYFGTMMSQLGIPAEFLVFFVIILIWSQVWKFLALWKSARNNSSVWFILFALVNTMGILEILYIFVFSKMKINNFRRKKALKRKRR
jgi:hypothetical protein